MPPPAVRSKVNDWIRSINKTESLVSERTFRFLNEQHTLNDISNWNDPQYSKLWLYNLHYFDDLNSSHLSRKNQIHKKLIDDWIRYNPVGFGNGWEPYPISLRIVNWIKWHLNGNELEPAMMNSLAIQVRFLKEKLEYHILGNHLLANIKALIFSGLYFNGDEADAWLQMGELLLGKELDEQILEDGGHFERSPMYHSIILEDFLDLVNLYNTYNRPVLVKLKNTIGKMLRWLVLMCHPDGQISLFNDAAFEIAASPSELSKYAKRVDFIDCEKNCDSRRSLSASGYVRIVNDTCLLIADVGDIGPDYLPGHAHADTLSFEMSIFGQRVFVDSGTSTYQISEQRNDERSTSAHNTLCLDHTNSSDVWRGFRVGKRARVSRREMREENDCIFLSAEHDGYKYLSGKPIHRRTWRLYKKKLEIIDDIFGNGQHHLEIFFHLHPLIKVIDAVGSMIKLQIPDSKIVVLAIDGEVELSVKPSTYHPEFGLKIPSWKLVCRCIGVLPITIVIRLQW